MKPIGHPSHDGCPITGSCARLVRREDGPEAVARAARAADRPRHRRGRPAALAAAAHLRHRLPLRGPAGLGLRPRGEPGRAADLAAALAVLHVAPVRDARPGVRHLVAPRPAGPVRGADRDLHRRGVQHPSPGAARRRYRVRRHRCGDGHRLAEGRRAGRRRQLPALRHGVAARQQHPQPPGTRGGARGAGRAGRAHPHRRGRACGGRGAQPHRPRDARHRGPPRQPHGGAGRGRAGRGRP